MAKFVVAIALFALVALALAVPQKEQNKGTQAKSGDLQASSSFYGGFYGGYPYGSNGYGFGGPFYGGYGSYGYGYGYSYGGYGF